jgi:hypothetical protein
VPVRLPKDNQYPVVNIDYALFQQCIAICNAIPSDEVGWLMLVDADREAKTFTLTECIVPEQIVTGATVKLEKEDSSSSKAAVTYGLVKKYGVDGPKKLRCWAHSHVKMGCTPSGVDEDEWNTRIVEAKRDYYLFPIFNQRGEYSLTFYDPAYNLFILDCEFTILNEPDYLGDTIREQLKGVRKHKPTTYSNGWWSKGKFVPNKTPELPKPTVTTQCTYCDRTDAAWDNAIQVNLCPNCSVWMNDFELE